MTSKGPLPRQQYPAPLDYAPTAYVSNNTILGTFIASINLYCMQQSLTKGRQSITMLLTLLYIIARGQCVSGHVDRPSFSPRVRHRNEWPRRPRKTPYRTKAKQRLRRRQRERQNSNGPFSGCPKPLFQSEANCEAIDLKMTFFVLMHIKIIFTRKAGYLASFWKWEILELGKWPAELLFS